MKKFFAFAVLAAMALGLASCKKDVTNIDPSTLDNTVEKCWKVTYKTTVGGYSGTTETYEWATERALVIELQAEQKYSEGYLKCSYQAASNYKDSESCYKANNY